MKKRLFFILTLAVLLNSIIYSSNVFSSNIGGPLFEQITDIESAKKSFSADIQKEMQKWDDLYKEVKIGETTEKDVASIFGSLKPIPQAIRIVNQNIKNSKLYTTEYYLNGTPSHEEREANDGTLASYTRNVDKDSIKNFDLIMYELVFGGNAGGYFYECHFYINRSNGLVEKKDINLSYMMSTR